MLERYKYAMSMWTETYAYDHVLVRSFNWDRIGGHCTNHVIANISLALIEVV